MKASWLILPVLFAACTNTSATTTVSEGGSSGASSTGSGDGGTVRRDAGGTQQEPDAGGVSACEPPEVLIVLDRTGTMHRDLAGMTPANTTEGLQSSKIYQAITALDQLVQIPDLDQTLRIGLELFPRDPGGDMACLTMEERLNMVAFRNPGCEAGELVVAPALGTASAIAGTLDIATTRICFSTPTGSALVTARDQLRGMRVQGRDQYIMLVTDGADFYDSCPEPDPLVVLKELAAEGVKTFVVGFGAQDATPQGVNPPILNQMACAGQTAASFSTSCRAADGGGFEAVDPMGERLYFDAANSAELEAGLRSIAGQLCCECGIEG